MPNCDCPETSFPYQIQSYDIVGDIGPVVEYVAAKFGLSFADLMPAIYARFPNEGSTT